jgi:hypothetical protein
VLFAQAVAAEPNLPAEINETIRKAIFLISLLPGTAWPGEAGDVLNYGAWQLLDLKMQI